eukprot:scaffold83700_cov57-Phaeocystis_antarctica.AAC.1
MPSTSRLGASSHLSHCHSPAAWGATVRGTYGTPGAGGRTVYVPWRSSCPVPQPARTVRRLRGVRVSLAGGRGNAQLIPPERRDRHSLRRAAELGVLPAHFHAIAGQIVPADGGAAGVEPDGDHQNPTTRDRGQERATKFCGAKRRERSKFPGSVPCEPEMSRLRRTSRHQSQPYNTFASLYFAQSLFPAGRHGYTSPSRPEEVRNGKAGARIRDR